MNVQDLIERLSAATGPDRALDGQIAVALGFRKKTEQFTDESGQAKNRTIWLVPTGDDIARIPHYTASLEAAFILANTVSPDQTGGVSWVSGKGTAVINDGPYCEAATPPLALCIAALREKLRTSS